jgi:hypothetical protein
MEDAAAMRDLRVLLVVLKEADLAHERLPADVRAAVAQETDDMEVALLRLVPLLAATPTSVRERLTRTLTKAVTLLGDVAAGPGPPLRLVQQPAS